MAAPLSVPGRPVHDRVAGGLADLGGDRGGRAALAVEAEQVLAHDVVAHACGLGRRQDESAVAVRREAAVILSAVRRLDLERPARNLQLEGEVIGGRPDAGRAGRVGAVNHRARPAAAIMRVASACVIALSRALPGLRREIVLAKGMRVAEEPEARRGPECRRLLEREQFRLRFRRRAAIDEARRTRAAAVGLAVALRRVAVEVDAPEIVCDRRDVGVDEAIRHGVAQVLPPHAPFAWLAAIGA